MASLNKLLMVGVISTDIYQKATNSGDQFSKFSIQVERPERLENVPTVSDEFTVVAWRYVSEKCNHLKRGDLILVEGKLITRTYDDESGKRFWITEVDAKDIKKMGAGQIQPDIEVGKNINEVSFDVKTKT